MVWRRVRDYFRRSRARQAELKYKAFVKKARQTVRKRPGAAAASRATALAASFQQWLPVAAWALGTVAAYLAVLVAAASAGGGGVFVGGAVGLLGALVFGIGGAAYDVRLLRFVAVGMALAVLPAAYSGSTFLLVEAYSKATVISGPAGPVDIKDIGGHPPGDVYELKGARFQREWVGDYVADFPLPASDNPEQDGMLAGKEETATFCVVPVTPAGWTPADEVQMLAVCTNKWAGEADCRGALDKTYDPLERFGHMNLEACFDRLAGYTTDPDWVSKNGDTTYARRVDFGSFAAETLGFVEAARQDLVEKAAEAGRPLRLAAVPHLVQFFDAPCCAAQETQEIRGAVVLSFLFFSPFVMFALRVFFRDQLKRLTENVFLPTRKLLLKSVKTGF